MVDFNDNYIENAKMINISNEATAWNKKIQKPQLRGGVYYFKCNCDLTNGLQDDCRNPNCRSSYTKLTKRTCSCGRSMLKRDSEKPSKEEKKKDVGDGDGGVKETKKAKEPDVISEIDSKESKEKEVKDITAKESKQIEIKEKCTKEPKEKEIKEVKAKESHGVENKENKKPKEKESTESKKVKPKESKQIIRKKITTRRI